MLKELCAEQSTADILKIICLLPPNVLFPSYLFSPCSSSNHSLTSSINISWSSLSKSTLFPAITMGISWQESEDIYFKHVQASRLTLKSSLCCLIWSSLVLTSSNEVGQSTEKTSKKALPELMERCLMAGN